MSGAVTLSNPSLTPFNKSHAREALGQTTFTDYETKKSGTTDENSPPSPVKQSYIAGDLLTPGGLRTGESLEKTNQFQQPRAKRNPDTPRCA